MGISGFPSLWIALNLENPESLVHVSSVFIFYLRVCERNLPLWIFPRHFFNSSLYWSPGTIQSLSSLDQVNPFILAYLSVPYQVTKESSSSLYNLLNKGAYILSSDPSTLSDHFTTTIVDITPSWSWLLIIDPYGTGPFILIDSCSSSKNKPRSGWLPLGYNHSSKYWSICSWYWN